MIDMRDVRRQYVRGQQSFRELASEYGLNASTLRNRAAKEGWTSERAEYRTKVQQKATEISIQEDAVNMAKTIKAADLLDGVVLALLSELTENGLELLVGTRQPCRELESLSKALGNNADLKSRLLGILSPRDQAQLELAKERLAFEKSKTEKDNESTEVHVVLDGDLNRWAE